MNLRQGDFTPNNLLNAIALEIDEQPIWRANADKEMDYCDGNQLDSDALYKQRLLGIPPAIEPVMGPTIDEILGMEAKNRSDFRVLPDKVGEGDDVAEALNYRLNQAERRSKADRACAAAYASQVKVGLGWVEVSRSSDPFQFPIRCTDVHRNEIWHDWFSRKDDISDARWLLRRRWTDIDIATAMFPDQAETIKAAGNGMSAYDATQYMEGGQQTGLYKNWTDERSFTWEEQEWRDALNGRICLFELWYRKFEAVTALKVRGGRVVEFDEQNALHLVALANGGELIESVVGKVRLAWFAGPHLLHDIPSPYKHNHFPYFPFWGKREDRTRVPYGLARGMMFLQDEINVRVAKMQWGLSSVRVIRTEGAVVDDDDTFRDEVSRPDSDILLNAEAMANDGIFKIEKDFQLNEQQAARLREARESIRRAGRISEVFGGNDAEGRSGSAISQLVEQTVQSLGDINDNFAEGRSRVGEAILSMIIEDIGNEETPVTVDGGLIKEDRTIILNQKVPGELYLNNDTERIKLNVTISDVPSTPSFRAQELVSMSEAFKSMPPQFQALAMPHLVSLMNLPYDVKKELVEGLRKMATVPSEEEIQQLVDAAVEQARIKDQYELKLRKLEMDEGYKDTQKEKMITDIINKRIEAIFAAVQAGTQIVAAPGVAPAADQVLKSAGFNDQDQAPIVAGPTMPATPVAENTSPMFPARPGEPGGLAPPAPVPAEAMAEPDSGLLAGVEGGNG